MNIMTEIQFYHLLSTPLERALPKLMEKALSTGEKVLVLVGDEQTMDRLNNAMWTYEERSFLPHGSSKDAHPELQPIYITYAEENPANAKILVITDGSQLDDFGDTTKVLDMFNGHDQDEVAKARKRWKAYKDAGYEMRYIQQQENGGWKAVA